MVIYKVKEGSNDQVTFVNDITVLPPAQISGVIANLSSGSVFTGQAALLSGSTNAGTRATLLSGSTSDTITFSGTSAFLGTLRVSGTFDIAGTIGTTRTITAANSGPFAPLGFITVLVSGNSVKLPFFTV
jgi:hypothetical protein